MSKKLNKEFKEEFDSDFREMSYASRKYVIKIIIWTMSILILFGIFGIGYTITIGKWQKNAEREVFKDSVAYTEQAASFLAKSYKEYSDAETDADKKTIMEYVIMRYPNLDTDSIDNNTLK